MIEEIQQVVHTVISSVHCAHPVFLKDSLVKSMLSTVFCCIRLDYFTRAIGPHQSFVCGFFLLGSLVLAFFTLKDTGKVKAGVIHVLQ